MSEETTSTSTEQAEQTTEQTTEQVSTPEKSENMIPISRLNKEIEKRKGYEAELQSVADAMIADIPEAYQDIIPNTSPAETIKWIQRAKAKGLFNTVKADGPDSNTPGPSNTKPNLEGLSGSELFDMYHKNMK
jgi:hypothetical protein